MRGPELTRSLRRSVDNSAGHRTAATKRREAAEIGRRGPADTSRSRPAVLVRDGSGPRHLPSKRVSWTESGTDLRRLAVSVVQLWPGPIASGASEGDRRPGRQSTSSIQGISSASETMFRVFDGGRHDRNT